MGKAVLILRGGRVLCDGAQQPQALDIAIGHDGRILSLARGLPAAPAAKEIDVRGKLIAPALVDVHQHLDKTYTRRAIANPDGTLATAVAAFSRFAANVTREELLARAERTLEICLARGTIAVRTHANVDPDLRTKSVEALVELRERWKGRVILQVVAFVTGQAPRMLDAARGWLNDALAAGADVVGGTPALASEPSKFLDLLFDAAERHGRPIDLHLDEHLDPERHSFAAVIERTRGRGMQGKVAAGHCSALSAIASPEAERIIAGLRDAGIAVITLPSANLFLQGRDVAGLAPRGLTRVRDLLAAGVKVATASDNLQDPFVPVGTGDLLEIARWTLLAGHLGLADLDRAFEMVTVAPASIMGLENYGIRPGARADLLIADAEDAGDLVASGPAARAVMSCGRLVAGEL